MKFKNAKIKILLLSAVAVLSIGSVCGSLAYFADEGIARNAVSFGNIQIELLESATTDSGELTAYKDKIDVCPGCEVSKLVQVKNSGGQSAYVRVSVAKAFELAEADGVEPDTTLMTLDFNTEHWTYKDNYYYYNSALAPGELSEPLFTQVVFSGAISNAYQNAKARVTVNAFATQAANNGTSSITAEGWPEQ